jgi:hypothetical protein
MCNSFWFGFGGGVLFLAVVLFSCMAANAQEPETSSNPPEIITDSVVKQIGMYRQDIDLALKEVDSLKPSEKGFVSAAHRASFYKSVSSLKQANAKLYTYFAKVDPTNKATWLVKAWHFSRQSEMAMAESYNSLPNETFTPELKGKIHLSVQ